MARCNMKNAGLFCSVLVLLVGACNRGESYYTASDFHAVEKCDAHFHYLTYDTAYMAFARSINFRLLTPVWDGEEAPVNEQINIAASIKKSYPHDYAFFGTFAADSFQRPDFNEYVERSIRNFMSEGASGLKLWKNIGMVLKDSSGKYLMIDDPVFGFMFTFLVREKIPVIAHLGEPKNCWLPLEEMTDPGDASYFRNNPQFHMYLHPEVPSYEEQVQARDNILAGYPGLDFTGAHLGSLEWSVDELAKRLDAYGNFSADLAARIFHLQLQSEKDYEIVRSFMIRYQDRLIYGTDNEVHDRPGVASAEICTKLEKGWYNHWLYFATDSVINGVKGLKLPASVIDKLYYTNASRFFKK